MSNKTRHILFIIFAVLAFAASLYHTAGALQPFDKTPAWRHILFIGINTICIYGLIKRPEWFVWFFGVLTFQQLYSHGSYAIELWQQQYIVHWISVADILLLPLLLILLIVDKKNKQQV